MDPKSDGCRLCLDPFAECFTTIDNPQLKDQMGKVFCFPVESKAGYCSSVCQCCAYAISEFYQFSEKVRQNQEVLNGNVLNCDPSVDSKITFESVNFGMPMDSGISETTEYAGELKDKDDGAILDSKITFGRVNAETVSDSVLSETKDEACESTDKGAGEQLLNSDNDESYEPSSNMLNETDQLYNKHFRMVCDLCGTSAPNFTALRCHFRTKHDGVKGYVVCCNKKLSKRYEIMNHIDFHANPDVFTCEVCGVKYKNKHSLTRHMLCQHPSTDPLTYDDCSQVFVQQSALEKHKMRHVKLKCGKCNKIFSRKAGLILHMVNMHRAMACNTCGKQFENKQCLDFHMDEHMGLKVQLMQCEICQRWLKNEDCFQSHMKRVHNDGDRTFKCEICLQEYPNARALRVHNLQLHVECEICGKKFKNEIYLKEHRATHTDEVLHTCEHCGILFRSMSAMYWHIKKQHPTEWTTKKVLATTTKCNS